MSEVHNSINRHEVVLVVGGTGKTGRRVVARLRDQGIDTRVGARSSTTPFDWDDRATWLPALRGVHSAYVSYYPDLSVPAAPEAIAAFSALARESGVRRLVLLSGRGEPETQACEDIVKRSGVEWTIVRSSWFNQNFSESFLREAVMSGIVALPIGDVCEPFIDAEDIADVAAAALTDDRHAGALYEVTGPELMTFAEAAAEIVRATGRTVRFEQISLDAYCDAMRSDGVPADAVSLLAYLFTTVLDGRNSGLTDGVRRALGRDPTDFASYARRAAAAGAWND
jgi:uncharacterized protein YbjT (DUF2867 family)